ncbi:EF-hand calcium-binding domain-containing protein 6-like [Ptychodera flava]|uniref:EF-hand calcium-binding domain-containing protein 6-like n=1 Tax=Ptychodera flava TaxID=63121 RepID=UPI00396A47C9
MSQASVQQRPSTQMSQAKIGNLPEIPHPLSRLGNPDKLNIRGLSSRAGERPSSNPPPRAASEIPFHITPRLSRSATGRDVLHDSLDAKKILPRIPGPFSPTIPEGIEVTVGDPAKTKLPVFGARADLQSRAESRASVASRASERPDTRFRLEVDELEMILRDRAKRGFYELRKLFVSNDPEGRGTVSRDALHRIVMTFVGKFVGPKQFNHLMARLRLGEKQVIRLDEFYAVFREPVSTEMPAWMDPVNRHHVEKITMTSSQVHLQLKEKAKQRFLDVADLFPQMNPGGSGRILKPEFRNVLNKMLFFMDDDEFEKLWTKYDVDGVGVINGEKMLNKLGISLRQQTASPSKERLDSAESTASGRKLKKIEIERAKSLNVERWLKNKFREGCSSMSGEFVKLDTDKTGEVDRNDFIKVLEKFGLKLDAAQVDSFCARCGVEIKGNGKIAYKTFLQRFQDRSETGMPHNILSNPNHKFNKSVRSHSPSAASSITAVEARLMALFQRDFLALLGTFHKIDKQHNDHITQEEFRAAIESRFEIEISDDEFAELIDKVPLDDEGYVKYPEFMSQFDTKGPAPSLFESKDAVVKKADVMKIQHQETEEPMDFEEFNKGRSIKEITKVIKKVLKRHYPEVEEAFNEMDEINSRRMTQEMLYELLKKFDVRPEVTRGEIRKLWDSMITNANGTLDFLQFVRHFGHSLRSAAFPNAKLMPPKRGDADFMIRSRKLNCAADMLEDNLRAKIDYMWDDLRREFLELDQYGTGFVSRTEYRDILQELCVQLSDYELEMLCRKFDTKNDGRINYIEFLRPFAVRKQTHRVGNQMAHVMSHPQADLPLAPIVDEPQKGLSGLTARLRQKLVGDWRNLRRAFKKLDPERSGYLSVPEFRSVMQLCNVVMDEDEVYHVMSQFDENMNGKINYNKFLSETFKADIRESPYASI